MDNMPQKNLPIKKRDDSMYKGHKRTGCASCRVMIKNATSNERKTKKFKLKLSQHHIKQQKKVVVKKTAVKKAAKKAPPVSSSRSPPSVRRSTATRVPRANNVAAPNNSTLHSLSGRFRSVNSQRPPSTAS